MQLNVARLPQLDCLVRHDGLFQQNHLREFMKTTKHLRNYGIGALQSTRTEIQRLESVECKPKCAHLNISLACE